MNAEFGTEHSLIIFATLTTAGLLSFVNRYL